MSNFELTPGKQPEKGEPQLSGEGDDFSTQDITRVSESQSTEVEPIKDGVGCATGLNTKESTGAFTSPFGDVAYSFSLGPEMLEGEVHEQQDAICITQDGIAVADGVGGRNGGQEASHIVISSFYRFRKAGVEFSEAYRLAIQEFRNDVGGTTFTAFQIQDGTLKTLSIGDSMVMVIREGNLVFSTEEQSWQNVLIKALEKRSHEELKGSAMDKVSPEAFNALLAQCDNWSELSNKEQVEKIQNWYVEKVALIRKALDSREYNTLPDLVRDKFTTEDFQSYFDRINNASDLNQKQVMLNNIIAWLSNTYLAHHGMIRGNGLCDPISRGLNPEIDQKEFDLMPGDIILITTDGLFPYSLSMDEYGNWCIDIDKLVTDQDIKEIVSKYKSPALIVEALLQIARARGSDDNSATAVVEYRPNNQEGRWRVEVGKEANP